jgi:hypothetical protein
MATTSFTALRRLARIAFALMLLSLCLTGIAIGQAPPAVTASAPAGLTHPTGWGTIEQTAIDSNGDWLVVDYSKGAAYLFPANGGAMITLVAPGGLGGYNNPVALFDPANNIYFSGDWNNCLEDYLYDAATNSWPGMSVLTPTNNTAAECGTTPPTLAQYSIFPGPGFPKGTWYFQPWGVAIGNANTSTNPDNIIVGNQNGNYIFSMNITGAWSNPSVPQNGNGDDTNVTGILYGMTNRPISIAADPEGNIYFVEDANNGGSNGGAYLPGVYQIPASAQAADIATANAAGVEWETALSSDCPVPATAPSSGAWTITGSSCLTRVDPNLPNVTGVVTDAAGNLYISDGSEGVFMVPNPSGTPAPSDASLLTTLPTQGEVAVDPARKVLYVPTTKKQNNGQADVAKVGIGYAEFGALSVGKTTATNVPVEFDFNSSVTPANFTIVETGMTTPEFSITGGTCTTGSAYAALSSCTENLNFTPAAVGSSSARLLMQTQAPAGSPIAATQYSVDSKGILTLTAANTFSAGELVTINDNSPTDPLYALTGLQFSVMAAGLSSKQFEVQTSLSTAANGSTSATVQGWDYVTVANMLLHGTGLGAIAQVASGLESAIGSTLETPTQAAIDTAGNIYVADPGQGKVLMYPAGSGASTVPSAIGTGLTTPTGVAVDGAGDIFIADSGTGSVYEIPFGQSEIAGLAPESNPTSQVTLVSGLGTSGLRLAADGVGDLYVADPSNGHMVRLAGIGDSSSGALAQTTTYLLTGSSPSKPTAVAVDSNNNLYVIDSDSETLFEFAGGIGNPTSVLSSLTGVTDVAVDPSGAVYLSSTSGTTRYPVVGGVVGSGTAIAPDVTHASSVALDRSGNVYLTAAAGPSVTLVSTVGTLSLPTPSSLTSSTSNTSIVTNAGNGPLTVTGYTGYSFVLDSVTVTNFTGADGSPACVADSPIAAGDTCQVAVTFLPGPGQQGPLTGWVQAASNAVNAPITIDTTGTGLGLAGSKTQITVGSGSQVISTPVTVTVTSASEGGVTPTGTVQVSYPSWTVVVPSTCASAPCAPTINQVTVTAALPLIDGVAQFTGNNALAPVLAGPQTFTVGYTGDRVYGESTGSTTANVAKSSIAGFIADSKPPSYLPFVEEGNPPSSVSPYDGTQLYWTYSMPVTVNTAIGIPTGTITFNDNSAACPTGTSASGVGAAICLLANYSGIACPQSLGSGAQYVVNNTNYSSATAGATATFGTSCLQMPEFTTYTPVVSTHYITPVYSGDANFNGATDPVSTLFQALAGPLVNITPTAPAAPSVPISAASVTVHAGSTANLTLYLAPLLGYGFQGKGGILDNYNFPVTLTCDNLPPHAECTFAYPSGISSYQPNAPNSAQICPQPNLDTNSDSAAAFEALAENGGCNANGVGVVTLTINTNVSTGTNTTGQNAAAASVTLASIFGVGMIGLFIRRKAFEKARRLLMMVLMIVGGGLAVTLSACNTTNLAPLSQVATPSGTYAVTITASQVGTQCVPLQSTSSNCTTASGGQGKLVAGSNNQVSLPYYINVTVQ